MIIVGIDPNRLAGIIAMICRSAADGADLHRTGAGHGRASACRTYVDSPSTQGWPVVAVTGLPRAQSAFSGARISRNKPDEVMHPPWRRSDQLEVGFAQAAAQNGNRQSRPQRRCMKQSHEGVLDSPTSVLNTTGGFLSTISLTIWSIRGFAELQQASARCGGRPLVMISRSTRLVSRSRHNWSRRRTRR